MKTQRNGLGYGALEEDFRRSRPSSRFQHCIPESWRFSEARLGETAKNVKHVV